MEHVSSRHRNSLGVPCCNSTGKDCIEFQRSALLVIYLHGRLVRAHSIGKIKHATGKFPVNLIPLQLGIACRNNLKHDLMHKPSAFNGCEEPVHRPVKKRAEPVERNIPDKLLPARHHEIVYNPAINPASSKFCSNSAQCMVRQAAESANLDTTRSEMMDSARFAAICAEKGNAPHDPFRAEQFCQGLLVAQAVLQSKDYGALVQEWSDQGAETTVGKCFETDENQIYRADFQRVTGNPNSVEVEIAVDRADREAVRFHGLKIPARQERHLCPASLEQSPVIQTEGSGADHRYVHRELILNLQKNLPKYITERILSQITGHGNA
jgi:hypothetical protein